MSGDTFTARKLAWIEQVACDPDLPPLPKVAATVLALRYLNRETGDAWPAIATLASDIGRSETQTRQALRALESAGHAQITATAGGSGHTNKIKPVLVEGGKNPAENREKPSEKPNPSENRTPRKTAQNPAEIRAEPCGNPHPNPIEEPIEEPSERETPPTPGRSKQNPDASNGFEIFWSRYPRKVAKEAARKVFASAIRTTSLDAILDGVTRYAAERVDADPKYTKHPATWLRAGCWQDEAAPRAASSTSSAGGRKRWSAMAAWEEEHGVRLSEPVEGDWSREFDLDLEVAP